MELKGRPGQCGSHGVGLLVVPAVFLFVVMPGSRAFGSLEYDSTVVSNLKACSRCARATDVQYLLFLGCLSGTTSFIYYNRCD